jgi:hypothetical protein
MRHLTLIILVSLLASCAAPCVYMKSSPYKVERSLRLHSFTR